MCKKIEDYYNALAPRLTGYLVASGSSYETACEIVQESFLKLWRRWDTVENEPERVSGLLWTIARNLRTDRFRRERRITFEPEAGMDKAGVSVHPEKAEDSGYLRKRIEAALAVLPPLLRETYTLFHVAELSVREIAHQTNSTESVVKVRIFRAKQKLQLELKDLKTWGE